MNKRFTSNTSWSLWKFYSGLMRAFKEKEFDIIVIAPKDKYSEKGLEGIIR